MIRSFEDRITVWLGEGDIGTCLVTNKEGEAIGIGFHQLKKSYGVGIKTEEGFINKDEKYISINFANQGGIESLFELLESFLKKVSEDNRRKNDEPKATPEE